MSGCGERKSISHVRESGVFRCGIFGSCQSRYLALSSSPLPLKAAEGPSSGLSRTPSDRGERRSGIQAGPGTAESQSHRGYCREIRAPR